MLISELAAFGDTDNYDIMLDWVKANFDRATTTANALFTTDTFALWEAYLDSFPASLRQTYNCRACSRFIKTYGGLVVIDDRGRTKSVLWSPEVKGSNPIPAPFYAVFKRLAAIVEDMPVTGQFFTTEKFWGDPGDESYQHLSITPPSRFVMKADPLKTPFQAMADARRDFETVSHALSSFRKTTIDEAIRMVEADAVARSKQYVAPLKWLRGLYDRPRGRAGENLLWLELSGVPAGYKHPRSAATGSLIEDIEMGLPFNSVQARFNAKMHPLKYQRPQAAPSVGNIRRAEEVFEKLGLASALERRFARLDEVTAIWRLSPLKTALTGIFGHLETAKSKNADGIYQMPRRTMSWAKFSRTILPTAKIIELQVPGRSSSFTALLTAEHADAPPILKWDREDQRNPVSWYFYHGATTASQWNLSAGEFVPVMAICNAPSDWGKDTPQRDAAILILKGAVDSRTNSGNALFPETLREELREVRSTIEAYSKRAVIGGRAEASACGLAISDKRTTQTVNLLVDGNLISIDRFE